MEAIEFDECNVVFAKDQPEYQPLHSHKTDDGLITSCWKLSFIERVKILLSGCLYLQVLTFNKPLQPLKMSVDKPVLYK